jgi:hypothetical protein
MKKLMLTAASSTREERFRLFELIVTISAL